MNWYKKSQFTEENTQNISTPIIMVQPYEPLVQEVVDEIYSENPNFFIGINKINIDMGYGQFGSVISTNPSDINLNLGKIQSEIISVFHDRFDINDLQHKEVLKQVIKRVIIHEKAHVEDALQAQKASQESLMGEQLFPGGEFVAERAGNRYFN